MLQIVTLTIATLLACPTFAQAAVPGGSWATEDGTVVEFGACNERLCGWSVTAAGVEGGNERDPDRRGGSGRDAQSAILRGFRADPDEEDVWSDGQFHHPDSGDSYYDCELRRIGPDRLEIEGHRGVQGRRGIVRSRFPTRFILQRATT